MNRSDSNRRTYLKHLEGVWRIWNKYICFRPNVRVQININFGNINFSLDMDKSESPWVVEFFFWGVGGGSGFFAGVVWVTISLKDPSPSLKESLLTALEDKVCARAATHTDPPQHHHPPLLVFSFAIQKDGVGGCTLCIL